MIRAYSPAHLTCFFQPAPAADDLSSGSRGAGIKLDAGATVEVSENLSKKSDVEADGVRKNVPAILRVLEIMAPGRGFSVTVENGLPPGQGFGMSASGAIAAALCMCEIVGADSVKAFEAAHAAEVQTGGGLGDVSGIMCPSSQPVRVSPGLPPRGEAAGFDTGIREVTVAVLGPKVDTLSVIGNAELIGRLDRIGAGCMDAYLKNPSTEALFSLSNRFSSEAGLESGEVSKTLENIRKSGRRAAMCMLGNSIFSDASVKEVSEATGTAFVRSVPTTGESARIIRKA